MKEVVFMVSAVVVDVTEILETLGVFVTGFITAVFVGGGCEMGMF